MAHEIMTKMGLIEGIQKGEHLEFLGIRYAQAPIGELRFQEPMPVEKWDGVYDATQYGPMAPQIWTDDPPIDL